MYNNISNGVPGFAEELASTAVMTSGTNETKLLVGEILEVNYPPLISKLVINESFYTMIIT